MSEDRDDIIVLLDENDNEVEFQCLDILEMNGNEYAILIPLDEEVGDEEEEEIVILKIEHGEDGEDSFVDIEDEEELDMVFEEFKARMEEED